jgi:predicted TIM-barrel fold metal-dependent hydrolase
VSMPTDIGIVDPMMGFPHTSVESKMATYDFFRPLLKDRQSREEFEFPAQYMFKDVPDLIDPSVDPVQWTVDKMDEFNIQISVTGVSEHGIRAKERYPERFYLSQSLDPNTGMDAVRKLEQAKRDHDVVYAQVFPSGCFPQVPINDKKMYPLYAKCVELDLPMCINAGVVGPRMPFAPQKVELLDEVCYDFPDLTIVMMHGAEPWTALAVKLMLKWPGLHYMTSAFAPKHYPKDVIAFANTRGADKVFYCGYFPATSA